MVLRNWGLAALAACGCISSAQAWYGPFCYSSKSRQVTLTIPTITGESPGDLKVTFDDNDGKAKLAAVRASKLVKNAHEVVLSRDDESRTGVFAVIATSPRSTYGYKFEIEFRDNASECTGAIIKVSDKSFADGNGAEPEAIETKPVAVRAKPKPRSRPKAKLVEESEDTGSAQESAQPSGELMGPTQPSQQSQPAQQSEPAQTRGEIAKAGEAKASEAKSGDSKAVLSPAAEAPQAGPTSSESLNGGTAKSEKSESAQSSEKAPGEKVVPVTAKSAEPEASAPAKSPAATERSDGSSAGKSSGGDASDKSAGAEKPDTYTSVEKEN